MFVFGLMLCGALAAACFVLVGCFFVKKETSGVVVGMLVGLVGLTFFAVEGYRLSEGTPKELVQFLPDGIYSVEGNVGYNGVNVLLAECEIGSGEMMKKDDDLVFFRTGDPAFQKILVVGAFVQVDGNEMRPFAFPRPPAAAAPTSPPPEKQ